MMNLFQHPWRTTLVLSGIIILASGIIFLCEYWCLFPGQEPCRKIHNKKRTVQQQCERWKVDVVIDYKFQFDLCDVNDCGNNKQYYRSADLYLCFDFRMTSRAVPNCLSQLPLFFQLSWGTIDPVCHWDATTIYTGLWTPHWSLLDINAKSWWDKVTFQRDYDPTNNPVTLSLDKLHDPPNYFKAPGDPNPYHHYRFMLRADINGKDPMSFITIKFNPSKATDTSNTSPTAHPSLAPAEIYGEMTSWLYQLTIPN